jgi:hypothetical protein
VTCRQCGSNGECENSINGSCGWAPIAQDFWENYRVGTLVRWDKMQNTFRWRVIRAVRLAVTRASREGALPPLG